jgi:hypothetical protein
MQREFFGLRCLAEVYRELLLANLTCAPRFTDFNADNKDIVNSIVFQKHQ